MGKNDKKKRRKERLRQQRLEQLSTFGSLNVSPKNGSHVSPPHTPALSVDASDSTSTSNNEPTHPVLFQEENVAASSAADNFGSVASRIRTLPVISFVFPKCSDQSQPLPYEFRISTNTKQLDAPIHTTSDDLLDTDQISSMNKQSIDDILFPRMHASHLRDTISRTNDTTTLTPSDVKQRPRSRSMSDELSKKQALFLQEEATHRLPYLSGISVEEAVRDKVGLRPRANSTDGELKLPQRGLCDERKVLESYKWRENMRSSMPKGFQNLGNTCFLNSTLQCLAYCPPFCQSLMDMPNVDARKQTIGVTSGKKVSPGKTVNHGRMFTLTLADLFRRMHKTEGTNGTMSPRRIVSSLPLLGSGHSRRNGYKFRPGRQEDAHEFLVHLLDAMNDGELREAGINADKSGWRDRLPVPRLDETTFIHRIFGGYLRSQVRCTDCGYRSNTYDPFLDLSLEISRNSCQSISSALHEFTRKETLDSQNRWKCSGCKKRVCATKQLTVFRPPLSLCIQLKRFTFGASFRGFSMGGKKISKPIEFPAKLQLPLSDGRSCGYTLTGIVIHVGGSANSGHYTAYVQRPGCNGEQNWFLMDDSFVQQVSEQHVLRQRDAYVIMYCRQEVKVEFPTPPLRGSMTADEAKELVQSRIKARTEGSAGIRVPTGDGTEELRIETSSAHQDCKTEVDAIGSSLYRDTQRLSVKANDEKSAGRTRLKANGTSKLKGDDLDSCDNSENASKREDELALSSVVVSNGSLHSTEKLRLDTLGKISPPEKSKENERRILPAVAPKISSEGITLETTKSIPSDPKSDGPRSPSHNLLSATESNKLEPTLSRISVDRGDSGKVEVMMRSGLAGKRAWIPKTANGQNNNEYDLLGNLSVSKWEDDDEDKYNGTDRGQSQDTTADARAKITKAIQKAEQDRKRKLFLDRHDAMLDQGKLKKVKSKSVPIFHSHVSSSANPFQRIQGLKQKFLRRRSR